MWDSMEWVWVACVDVCVGDSLDWVWGSECVCVCGTVWSGFVVVYGTVLSGFWE